MCVCVVPRAQKHRFSEQQCASMHLNKRVYKDSIQCVYACELLSHSNISMCVIRSRACVCALTLRQAIPHVQPVVLAVALSHQQGVVLQVKGQECESDVHVGRGDDHVGALQIMRVFIREPRGVDHAGGAGEIAEAEF